MKWFFSLLSVLVIFVSISCSSSNVYTPEYTYMSYIGVPQPQDQSDTTLPDNVSYWEGRGVSGQASIIVNLTTQRAEFYRDNRLVGISAISTGKQGHSTPTGNYRILELKKDKVSNLYGTIVDDYTGQVVNPDATPNTPRPPGTHYKPAEMPFWMRLTNGGVGMHAGFLPGYAASHGCIRMPLHMAEHFFHNVEKGTPVRVTY